MLVLRTSYFRGATIRPIVPGHKHSIDFIIQNQNFLPGANLKKKADKTPLNNISICLFSLSPLVYKNIFTDDYYPSRYFLRTYGHYGWADSASPPVEHYRIT